MFKKDVENDIIYLLVEYKVPVIVEGKDVIDFRDENSFIYGFGLSNMQVLVAILLLFAMIFNKNPENISGVLRWISITIQVFIGATLGIKELVVKKNRILAYLYLGIIFIVIVFIISVSVI